MTVDATSGSGSYFSQLTANSDALTAASATKNANATDTSAAAKAKTKDDKDMFLKLLVAQLRYQDPSKPADTTQFMAQTAQFSALEAMQDVATQSSSMVAAQNKLQASTMVGQTVSYTDENGKVVTGEVKSVSFTQGSVGGTNGEPVLNVDGVSVVLSKVSGVGSIDATALNAAAEKAAAEAKAKAEGTSVPVTTVPGAATGSSSTASSGTASTGTSGATGTSQTAPATGTPETTQTSGTTGAQGSTNPPQSA
ncbi:flagellar hook capping FlgD N-terminal domain-containing protein [Kineococcus rhizosphaerae]|uniref:Basal-body rod modification protein FlgD n=1 Tax=Kineococcus rhizosphaerae TaxID=559628 RepID=A0A2T0RAL5_9ACTN|nr:flagellar hook capping FlgD N-terminal domain-containing protein [Kineococcus rhizosphaerae]PRY18212.1 flagellar basal-body rod modification protein FlgD [Kineococcus rhizosphaerae]